MDSRQAILPAALRVNANLFQTDLCRNPEYKDVLIDITSNKIEYKNQCVDALRMPSMATGSRQSMPG